MFWEQGTALWGGMAALSSAAGSLTEEQGPRSAAATVLRNLTKKRAKDRQVFAWQLGQYYFVGPPSDAEMEARIREFIEDDLLE